MRNRFYLFMSLALVVEPVFMLKDATSNVKSSSIEGTSEAKDFEVSKQLSKSSSSEERNLGIWGGFMTLVHCHTPGKKHDHCHHHHQHSHSSGSLITNSTTNVNACDGTNCQSDCSDGQCFDADGNPCYGNNCTGVDSSTIQQPTYSPSTEISNDMCWYCIGNSNADIQNNNMQGIMYGGVGLAGLVAIVLMVLRKRNVGSKKDHLLSGSVGKRMMTVASRFEFDGSMVDFDNPHDRVDIVTDYYKA